MKLKKRYLFPLLLGAVVFLGPRPSMELSEGTLGAAPADLTGIEAFIDQREAATPLLKPDNEARILWADSVRQTPWSVVYLHGFSASPMESGELVRELGELYGANVYYARFPQHGIADTTVFKDLTPKMIIDAAAEAIAIGRLLGEQVLLVSCSTGSTAGAYVAAQNPGAVAAHVMYSPNFALNSAAAGLLNGPWGKQLVGVLQGEYRSWSDPKHPVKNKQYWTTTYHSNGVIMLQNLIEATVRPEVVRKVTHPIFIGYYYRDDEHKDEVVSIPAMQEYYETVATPEGEKEIMAFANVNEHVIASHLKSADLASVRGATRSFLEEQVDLVPVGGMDDAGAEQ